MTGTLVLRRVVDGPRGPSTPALSKPAPLCPSPRPELRTLIGGGTIHATPVAAAGEPMEADPLPV